MNIDFVNHEAATIGTKKSKRADATNVVVATVVRLLLAPSLSSDASV